MDPWVSQQCSFRPRPYRPKHRTHIYSKKERLTGWAGKEKDLLYKSECTALSTLCCEGQDAAIQNSWGKGSLSSVSVHPLFPSMFPYGNHMIQRKIMLSFIDDNEALNNSSGLVLKGCIFIPACTVSVLSLSPLFYCRWTAGSWGCVSFPFFNVSI